MGFWKERRRQQVRRVLCLLFLSICFFVSGCGKNRENVQNGQDSAKVLDVWFFACSEDADSILLQTPEADVVIDTGVEADSEDLVKKLKELQVDDIELLILTHPDKDHIGGAEQLLDQFPVEQVIQTSCEKGSELQEILNEKLMENPGEKQVQIPETVQERAFGELQLTIYPPKEKEYKNSNNYSIGVLARFGGKSFFFAGDAKKKRIEELLEESLPDVDVYKVAHHGRDNGASEELIEQLQPEFAVVTAARAEEKTENALSQLGTEIFSTYERDVHFSVKDGVLDVR